MLVLFDHSDGFRPQGIPECFIAFDVFTVFRNICEQEDFQLRYFPALLRFLDKRTELIADDPVAFGGHVIFNECLQRLRK